MIYAFTQWLAALALVVANAELRFLWLTLATAVLVAAVILTRRSLQRDPDQDNQDPQRAA
jgi:bacteriorhodopsin